LLDDLLTGFLAAAFAGAGAAISSGPAVSAMGEPPVSEELERSSAPLAALAALADGFFAAGFVFWLLSTVCSFFVGITTGTLRFQ
jgi:hypothetical protein